MNKERIDEVVDQLVGTALDLRAVITDEEFESEEFLLALDAKCFQCANCGWWFQPADKGSNTSETVCMDCDKEDGHEEED